MNETKFVVTVTDQFASNGRVIAKRLGALLGVPCYSEEIGQEAGRTLGLPKGVVNASEERSRRPVGDTFFPFLIQSRGSRASEMQNRIFQTQETIIRRLAAEGSCILVGRCADFILADEPDAMHIYIYAAYADRLCHCMRWKDVDEDAARRLIRERDEERSAYHLNFAGYTPDDKAHKDLLISSSLLGTEGTALLLADAVRARFSRVGAEARAAHRLPRQHKPGR